MTNRYLRGTQNRKRTIWSILKGDNRLNWSDMVHPIWVEDGKCKVEADINSIFLSEMNRNKQIDPNSPEQLSGIVVHNMNQLWHRVLSYFPDLTLGDLVKLHSQTMPQILLKPNTNQSSWGFIQWAPRGQKTDQRESNPENPKRSFPLPLRQHRRAPEQIWVSSNTEQNENR